jgi:hypothetical protein
MVFLILKLSHYFIGLLLRLYVVACHIEWLCSFFLGFWSCFGPKSIDSSFLLSCRHCCCCRWRCFNRVHVTLGPFLFLKLSSSTGMLSTDEMVYCDCFLILWRYFWTGSIRLIDFFGCWCRRWFIVALHCTSFIASFVFNHGIDSSCLLNGPLLGPPHCCYFNSHSLFVGIDLI